MPGRLLQHQAMGCAVLEAKAPQTSSYQYQYYYQFKALQTSCHVSINAKN
jgi:hypothetical protein